MMGRNPAGQSGKRNFEERKGMIFKKYFAHGFVCFFILGLPLSSNAVTVGPFLKSKEGMVVAANPHAARVGAEILEKGGNALDAAIGVSFALGVVEPYASGIGGEGYAIVALADGRKFAIDFRSTAPALATYENIRASGKRLRDYKHHPRGVCVPGVVAGAARVHDLGAHLRLRDLMAPAIRLAEAGFEVNETFARVVKDNYDKLLKNAPDFLKGDLPWEEGDQFRNPTLGRTLRLIAENGSHAFYGGELADRLDAFMKKNDGWVYRSDLVAYKATLKKPLRGTYKGYDLYVPGNPVGGPRLLASLNILENFNLTVMGWDDPLAIHIMQEVFLLTGVDQRNYVGDPSFDPLPEQGFTSKQYARRRMMQISLDRASDPAIWLRRAGSPADYDKGEKYVDVLPKEKAGEPKKSPSAKSESPSTTHFSVIDKKGNAVSWTQTLSDFFGTGFWVDGYFLNNEMNNFASKPEKGNPINLVPGKRPRTTIVPSIVEKEGKIRWIVGSPGGGRIVSTVAQILIGLIDHGMTLEEAVKKPKFVGYHAYKEIQMEKGFPASSVKFLTEVFGHKVKIYDYPDLYFGGPNILSLENDGTFVGMGSIRRKGAAAAPDIP